MGRSQVLSGLPFVHERVFRQVYSDRIKKLRLGFELEVSVNADQGLATPTYRQFLDQFSYQPAENALLADIVYPVMGQNNEENNPVKIYQLVPRYGYTPPPDLQEPFIRFYHFCSVNMLQWSGDPERFLKKVADIARSVAQPENFSYGVPRYDERGVPVITLKPDVVNPKASALIEFIICCTEITSALDGRINKIQPHYMTADHRQWHDPRSTLIINFLSALLHADGPRTRQNQLESVISFMMIHVQVAAEYLRGLLDPASTSKFALFRRALIWTNDKPNRDYQNDAIDFRRLSYRLRDLTPAAAWTLFNQLFSSYSMEAIDRERERQIENERQAQWEDFSGEIGQQQADERDKANAALLAQRFTTVFPSEPMTTDWRSLTARGYKAVVFKNDASITPKGSGVEITSVPTQYDAAMRWLMEKLVWLDQTEIVSTNDSCSLHVNISVDKIKDVFTLDQSGNPLPQRLDVLKLLLFMGERRLLSVFQRTANTYTEQVTPSLRRLIRGDSVGVLRDTREVNEFIAYVNQELGKLLREHKRLSFNIGKFNTHNPYAEFRAIGGANYHRRLAEVRRAVQRYAQLMVVATDPQLFRREYVNALYRLLASENR